MTFLDIRTLLVVVILVLVVRAAIFGYLWRINPDYPPVRFWAIGALLVATGGIFLLLRDEASFLFSMLVANLMILTGWLSWSHGTLLATGTRSPWRVGAAMTMSCYAGIAYFGYADPDFFLRTVFQALPMMVMDIYVAIACMRYRGDPRRMTFMLLGITMLVLTVSNLWRLDAIWTAQIQTLFATTPGYVQFFLVSTVAAIFNTALYVVLSMQNLQIRLAEVATARSNEAEAAQTDKHRLELVLDASGDAPWDWDLRTGEIFVSERGHKLLGYVPGDIPLHIQSWEALIHSDDLVQMQAQRAEYLAGKRKTFANERRVRCKNGEWCWVLSRARFIRDAAGNPVRMIGTWSDISARKKVEAAQIYSVLEASADGMLVANHAGRIVFANSEAESLFGYGAGDLVNRQIEELIPSQYRLAHLNQRINYALMSEKRKSAGEAQPRVRGRGVRGLRCNGTEFPVQVSLSPFELLGESVVIVAAHDLSDHEEAERAVRQMNESLELLVTERTHQVEEARREAEAARELAEVANRTKSDFVANMSHEIRTPLNAVLGLTHLALRATRDMRQRDYLEKIHRSGEHLLGIVNDILDFSKIEAGKMEIEHIPFVIDDVLQHLRQMVEERAVAKGLRFNINIPEDIPHRLFGDPLRISQILINFANNAVKFTERGEITVSVTLTEHVDNALMLRFAVRDTGIGIAPESLQHLFKPFEQADASISRRFGGTGLGLTISRQLAELMFGEVGVSSEVGHGSEFWFSALVMLDEAAKDQRQEACPCKATRENMERPTLKLEGCRVLLAEDNSFNQQVAQEMLADAGIAVALAENGQEVLDWLARERFDAVLMDMQMPVMDGLTATRRLRENPEHANLVVIAMTANATRVDEANCRAAGMDDFITKPVRPDALYATLRHWVGRNGTEDEETLREPSALPDGVTLPMEQGVAVVLDAAVLYELAAGQPQRLRKLCKAFLDSSATTLKALEAALEQGDIKRTAGLGHKLKSSARWAGAIAMGNLAERLEQLDEADDLVTAREISMALAEQYAQLEIEITAVVASSETATAQVL